MNVNEAGDPSGEASQSPPRAIETLTGQGAVVQVPAVSKTSLSFGPELEPVFRIWALKSYATVVPAA